ncbi:DUF4091 domain-containing protein [Paenibacillus sp. HB172176]|uniref:DUF4091 domain-containing protein n=1 Tax=Paenibacillus sp. HB172176 TaxID=2493690 RepID=UPI001F10CFD6|nr:DUF4091 domain-containing protein [Paenibacillus sp. HB172176]
MPTEERKMETRLISSLEKVFADEELQAPIWKEATALRGETYSFQVAFRPNAMIKPLLIRTETTLQAEIAVRSVGLVPSELPCYSEHDDNVLRTSPGLYPDPLYPPEEQQAIAIPGQWRAVWVTVPISEIAEAGSHRITIHFENQEGISLGSEAFLLHVLPEALPPQTLIHTEWFHTDCLLTQYGVEAFSEAHWRLISTYVETAARHGINMILTPLFTPPLDTEVGGERPTVQLVGVEVLADGHYRFSFERLARWMELCESKGIQFFEFSHLFTQWGANHAPKIIASISGSEQRVFGWDTDAHGEAYTEFLNQFLPELTAFIRQRGVAEKCCFHISDEPTTQHLESYKSAAAIVYKHLSDFPVVDALSDYTFYEQGLVKKPIVATNHLEPFLANETEDLWCYYCCAQNKFVSNRYFNQPSARNRILGWQLYKYEMSGFLHWGYNFWHSQYSKRPIDPFRVTDAGHAFPSGDPFLVYPGKEGPIESIRLEVFFEALQDLRALQLLESRLGRAEVLRWLEEDLNEAFTFKSYPKEAEWLLRKREKLNELLSAKSGDQVNSGGGAER